MRSFFSLHGPTELACSSLLLAATSILAPVAQALQFRPVSSPRLDLSQLGRVAVAGDFSAISLYQYAEQSQSSFNANGSQSLLGRLPTGAFAALQGSDAYITAMCPFTMRNGTLNGIVVGGNFTSLGGVEAQGVAMYNPTTNAIVPLPGLSGKVQALYCDQAAATVYVGGAFAGGNSTNAIAWVTGWTNLPFAGFNGPVTSITKNANGNIVFGGDFDGLGNTTTPRTRDGQVINLSTASVTASSSSTQVGFADPRNIICKTGQGGSGNTWLLPDNSPGSWTAAFGFGFVPTKLRLYNTNQDGRGTRTFRYTALPINGIMNLTYTDASTGQQRYCDASCPLPQNNNTYQDFHLVNPIGMNSFRIDISAWYGSGGGLSGIELFQDDMYVFAVNDFNEPTCGVESPSAATTTGPWTQTPSRASNSNYLTAQVNGFPVSPGAATVVFRPDIQQSGNYSVTIFTPGCQADGTCSTRGRVNVTGTLSRGTGTSSAPLTFQTDLFQTNLFDKYDQLYFGYVDASSGSFKPSVTLAPSTGQDRTLTLVAQRVRFELISSTGGLNGLYEYNPNQVLSSQDFSASAINRAGMSLGSGATVNALAVQGNNVYVGGDFNSSSYNNILSVGSNATSLPEGGLNGVVSSMHQNGSILYIGGSFTGSRENKTTGLRGVASFDTSKNTWVALGGGVNGKVNYIVPLSVNITAGRPEVAIALSGAFDEVNSVGSNASFAVNNFAVWVPGRSNWLHNLGGQSLYLQGILSSYTDVPGQQPLFGGNVASQASGASGAVEIGSSNPLSLQQFPVQISPSTSSSSSRKRAVIDSTTSGVVTGLLYEENNRNFTVLGGHFQTKATNGSTINNLVIINGTNSDSVTGLASGVNTDSTFSALGIQGTQLFAGGSVSGTVNGNNVNGIVVYDLVRAGYNVTQPPALSGSRVVVNAIAPEPSSSAVFVGGSFDGAGSFDCPALCIFDTGRAQWNSPGNGLTGNVTTLTWLSNTRLLIGGRLTVGGNTTALASYNPKTSTFQTFSSNNGPSGTVTALTPATSDGSQIWVGGTDNTGAAFLTRWDGNKWNPVTNILGSGSQIRGLQIFSLSDTHTATTQMPGNNALLLLGALTLPNYGNASAALYNGTHLTPFLLSTTSTGSQGSLSQIFVSKPANFFKRSSHHLAKGFVVLIALAIALALIFLLVVAGIFAERHRRKREGYMPAPTTFNEPVSQRSNMGRVPPETLFGSIGQGGRQDHL